MEKFRIRSEDVKLMTSDAQIVRKDQNVFYFTFLKVMPNSTELKCAYNHISALTQLFKIIQLLFEHRNYHFKIGIPIETNKSYGSVIYV